MSLDIVVLSDISVYVVAVGLSDVRFWLKADLWLGSDLRLLYPRKRTYFAGA